MYSGLTVHVYSSLVRLGPSCPVFLARTPLRRLVSVAYTYGTTATRRTCQHRSSRTCPLLTQISQMAPPSSSSTAGGGMQAPPVGEALLDGLRQRAAPVQEAALPSQGASPFCIGNLCGTRASLRPPVEDTASRAGMGRQHADDELIPASAVACLPSRRSGHWDA